MKLDTYLCLNCNKNNTEEFCSNCGSKLQITKDDIGELIDKRLINYGYKNIVQNINNPLSKELEYKSNTDLVQTILESTLIPVEKIFVYDRTNIYLMEILFLIPSIDNMELEKLLTIIHSIFQLQEDNLRIIKKNRINKFLFRFLIFDDKSSKEQVLERQIDIQRILNSKTKKNISCEYNSILIAPEISTSIPNENPLLSFRTPFEYSIIKNSLKQLNIQKSNNKLVPVWKQIDVINEPIEKIKSFFDLALNILIRPMYYAGEVDSGKVGWKSILSYITLYTFVVILFEKITNIVIYQKITNENIPVAFEEILQLFSTVWNMFKYALPTFILYRFFGGKGSFIKHFYTSIFFLILLMILDLICISYEKLFTTETFVIIDHPLNDFFNKGFVVKTSIGLIGSVVQTWIIFIYSVPFFAVINQITVRDSVFINIWGAFLLWVILPLLLFFYGMIYMAYRFEL